MIKILPINAPYYLDAADLSAATAVYLDSALTYIAPDGFYRNGTVVRQQSAGILLSVEACADCNECTNCILICEQNWTNENLDVITYSNGDEIPQVTDPTAWAALTTGAWCYYNNDPANNAIYGKLYNWYAVNDSRGLAPTGYHIPSDAEWKTLTTCLGGESVAGGAMKETGTAHWASPNTDATNSSGFTALPASSRSSYGTFTGIGNYGNFWSSTEYDGFNSWDRYVNNNNAIAARSFISKKCGLSIRLIKD
jgi:uncharacterized protein (TIGR02145 family)